MPPPLLSQRPTRRTLLKVAGVGGVLLGGAAALNHALRGFGSPKDGLRVFDAVEFDVLEKACDAMYPGPPEVPFSSADIGVPRFVDLYVSHLYEDTQELFRMLLRTLNLSSVVHHGATFRFLPRAQAASVLEEWRTSTLKVRRAGWQSLSLAAAMGYYEDERVRTAAGFTLGCAVDTSSRPTLWNAAPPRRGV